MHEIKTFMNWKNLYLKVELQKTGKKLADFSLRGKTFFVLIREES